MRLKHTTKFFSIFLERVIISKFYVMKKIIYIGLIVYAASCISCKDNNNDNNNGNPVMSETDRNFMAKAGYANAGEIDAAQLAMTKAEHDSVHMFAMMMIEDHQKAYDELKTLGSNLGVSIPQEPDAEHKQIKLMLQGLSGHAFDSAYMQVQVMDHQKAVSLFEAEANNGKHQRVKDYANKYLPGLRTHLTKAQNIAADL
jgi:putative membrane protein